MASLTRTDLIEELTQLVANRYPEEEIDFGGEVVSYAQRARAVFDSYATDLLITLHNSATTTNPQESNADYMFAVNGSSEATVRTFQAINRDNSYLFEGKLHKVMQATAAVSSLTLYPTLTYENTPAYYSKAVALTGVVTTIQYRLDETEGNYSHEQARLLSYSPDPDDEYGADRLVRITSDGLVDIILSRPDDWERIADIVTTRQTDDTAIIRSVLDSKIAILFSKGIL